MSMVEVTKEGDIATITLKNPPMNVLCSQLLDELSVALDDLLEDAAKVIIITGDGRAFVAGADISEMKDMTKEKAMAFAKKGQDVFNQMDTYPKPIIAAVNGFALGGGTELAMACDIRVASEAAKFGQPEVGLAVIPGFGGTQRLSRLVGAGKAMELILTGDVISAGAAEGIGLVQKVVPGFKTDENGEVLKNEKGRPIPDNGPVMDAAKAMAKKIAKQGPAAVRWAKEAIYDGLEMGLEMGMELEAELFSRCFETADQKEGMGAFLGKRKAEFKDE